jgi:AcrR family transcriptional regulator
MAAAPEAVPTLGAVEQPEALYSKLSPGPGRLAEEVADHQRARIHSAMVEVVADRGYEAVTVRELARLAGVSTRAFYEHFESKEECFLHTHELIVRRLASRLVAAQAGAEEDWRERVRLAFGAFARGLARDPRAGRLVLVEGFAAGPGALGQLLRTMRTFEVEIAESFSRAPDGFEMPLLLVKGMVAGMVSVARSRLLAGREAELPRVGDALAEWALSYHSMHVAEIAEADPRYVHGSPTAETPLGPSSTEGKGTSGPSGDRALLLSATAKLAAAEGYANLTERRIRDAAGAPRRSFANNFDCVDDCFSAALEQCARDALAEAARAQASAHTWTDGTCHAIAIITSKAASDQTFAGLCCGEIFAAGVGGIECRERLVAEIVEHVQETAAPEARRDALTVEASVGAVWGVLHQRIVTDRAWEAPRIAPMLAYLLLAPIVGDEAATSAIRAVGKQRAEKLDPSPGRQDAAVARHVRTVRAVTTQTVTTK